MAPETFLAWEAEQLDRYELVDGWPYAMVGAGRVHEEVAGAIFAVLWTHLEGNPCRAYKGDRKVQVGTDFFYPDVVVTCDTEDRSVDGPIKAPVAIVEVISRPTAAYDRREKYERYISLPSLEVYLIVDPEHRQVERYERASGWVRQELGPAEPISIVAIGFSCPQQRIFAALEA